MIKRKKRSIKKLKWGIAGAGRFTELSFIPTVSFLRRSSINSIYSRSIQRAKQLCERADAENAFDNYDEFLKSDINCIYVGSVNAHHYEQVIKAADAGKNILCEKPIALSSSQAKEMIEVCERNNVLLAVNYTHRLHPHVLKAKELLTNNAIGKLVSVNVNFNINFSPGDNFRFNKNLSGGGALRDLGSHTIDLLRFFGGEIIEIDGYMDNVIHKSEVEDFTSAQAKFMNGGYGYFNVSYNNKKAFNRIEILGHNGAMSIENLIGAKNPSSKLTIILENEAKKSFRKRGNKFLFFIKSIQKSFLKNEQPEVTGYDGLESLQLIEELEKKCGK